MWMSRRTGEVRDIFSDSRGSRLSLGNMFCRVVREAKVTLMSRFGRACLRGGTWW